MNIELEETQAGVLLPVKANPGAKKNAITGEHAGMLKVSVTQAPEKGKANDAIVKLLAVRLGLKKSRIRLTSGPASSIKKFLITGIKLRSLLQLLAEVTDQGK